MNITQAEFSVEALTKTILPEWKGSTIRGALGESLKKKYCLYPERKNCYKCKNGDICPYGYLYETQPKKSSEKFSAYKQVTKPIAIEPPLENKTLFEPKEKITFKINFFGKAQKYIPEIENALTETTHIGRFRNRGYGQIKYSGKKTKKIILEKPKENYSKAQLNFLTPTQLVFKNAVIADFTFSQIIKNISRKHSAITYFHEGKDEKINWKKVFQDTENTETISQNLEYNIIETYSSKNKKTRKNIGFTGKTEFDLSNVEDKKIMHYLLEFGQYCHIGKFSAFGYGKYTFTLT